MQINRHIYVVGTNTEGRHGMGTARVAQLKHGLMYGFSRGLCGDTYAICTKDLRIGKRSIPLIDIEAQLARMFSGYVLVYPRWIYHVPAIGCGLAGYRPEEIAPMFKEVWDLPNLDLCAEFKAILI
jgi:hypothetical protein